MNIKIILIGKTDDKRLTELTEEYLKRISRYIQIDWIVIDDLKNRKNLSIAEQKKQESELIVKKIVGYDYIVLLDEHGKTLNSKQFADFLDKKMLSGSKNVVFIIGGPYGFGDKIYQKADFQLSLSAMTFSHQIIRVLFTEQLYRAFTILNHEPYHHE